MRSLLISGLLACAITWLPAGAAARYVEVNGTGSAATRPDAAAFQAGVDVQARTAEEAVRVAGRSASQVMDALVQAGVREDRLSTARFTVQPVYAPRREPGAAPGIIGYRVANTLAVEVETAAELGRLLDVALANGANSVSNVRFVVSNPAGAMAEARALAMRDAKVRAAQLAAEAGAEVGEVLQIVEQPNAGPAPRPVMAMAARSAEGVPVTAGLQSVSVTVRVRFSLR